MSSEGGEEKVLLIFSSELTDLLQHSLSFSLKLLDKKLVTSDVHDWVVTAQGVSHREKAQRLVSCVRDRIKISTDRFDEFVELLKEEPFFKDVVEKISEHHVTLSSPSDAPQIDSIATGATNLAAVKDFDGK